MKLTIYTTQSNYIIQKFILLDYLSKSILKVDMALKGLPNIKVLNFLTN